MAFGKILKDFIEKQELTIYQLAKETGIDRSFLQGVLRGTKKLPPKRFADIVNREHFSCDQIQTLCEEYFTDRFGKEKTDCFKRIEKGLSGQIKEELDSGSNAGHTEISEEPSFYSSAKDVANAVYTLLGAGEVKSFISNFDFSAKEINKIVYAACKSGKIKDFFHYVAPGGRDRADGIEMIFNMLCYAEAGYITYLSGDKNAGTVFPYFLIADSRLLMFDETAENAVLMRADKIDLFLKRKIYETKKHCRKGVHITETFSDYLDILSTLNVGNKKKMLTVFANGICPELISPETADEETASALKGLPYTARRTRTAGKAEDTNKNGRPIIDSLTITYDALYDFAKNGVLKCLPYSLTGAVAKNKRQILLASLVDKTVVGKVIVTNPNFFSICHDISYRVDGRFLILITSGGTGKADDYNGRILLYTDSKSIIEDFKDYLDYILLSTKAYPKEASEEMIQMFIDRLKDTGC